MADSSSDRDDLFAQWRKQVETGTDAWIKTVRQLASQGHVPPPPDPMQFWRQFSNLGTMNAPPFPGAGPVDPQVLAQWKRFLDDWIATWSRALEKAMGTEAFAEALGKTLDQFLTIQGRARQAAERSGKAAIDAVGLPSREQVVGLSRQMMDLEDRLEALDDKIEDVRNGPRPTDLGDRLEALEDKIESLRNNPRIADPGDRLAALEDKLEGLRDNPRMMDLGDRLEALENKIEGLRDSPRMMDLGDRLEALVNQIEGLRNSPPAPDPATGDGSAPRRPAGDTATAGGGAGKTSRTANVGGTAAKAGRSGATAGRGATTGRRSTTKTGAGATRTGAGTAKTGSSTVKTGAAKTGAAKTGRAAKTESAAKTGSAARTGSAATKTGAGASRTRKRRA